MRILTDVSAQVAPAREADLISSFHQLLTQDLPDGLVRTELLKGAEQWWHIQTLWRDRAALEAMRSTGDPPAAPRLFREVGADPTLVVLEVAAALTDPQS